ncbi:sulfotransferase 1C4-like [Ptychodera flava]|uniref:sulfotransferase 1C4-like n=1 Tax=Ptychodera flava TaxID=63121 RepID=UPI00396A40DC
MGFRPPSEKFVNFEVRPDDAYLITFPKSGTTWMKEILSLIRNGGDVDALKGTSIDMSIPQLEFVVTDFPGKDKVSEMLDITPDISLTSMESPRLLCTHLDYTSLPTQLQGNKKAKIIYLARNPKDVAVSTYYFEKLLAQQQLIKSGKTYDYFSDYVVDFVNDLANSWGAYSGMHWHDHAMEFWRRRHDENVLFLKYEDMHKDIRSTISAIATFLDVVLEEKSLDAIVANTSFEASKKNLRTLRAKYCKYRLGVDPETQSPFVRKGKVGGWKEYFTVADNEMFDAKYREWMKDSELEFDFEL